jgi:periplasmic protein TonB
MSDLGNLSQCMVDSDAAANGRARRLRGKALAASMFLEAVVVAGVLLWPLATLGVLSPQLELTPVPPYRGERNPRPLQRDHGGRQISSRRQAPTSPLFQPPVIPHQIAEGADPTPPEFESNGAPDAPGSSPLVPGGSENGRTVVEIVRPNPPSRPLKLSAGVMNALLVRRVQPDYPPIAKVMRLSGTVLLRATIGTDGEVHATHVLSGNPILVDAALRAVRQWRYRPTLLDGEPVEVETEITVNFVLGSY